MAIERNPEIGDIVNLRLDSVTEPVDVVIVKINRFTNTVDAVHYDEMRTQNPFHWMLTYQHVQTGVLVGVCKVQNTALYFMHDEVFFDK